MKMNIGANIRRLRLARNITQEQLAEVIALYRKYRSSDDIKARDMITKAYHDYPGDYQIMHDYM